jgi:molybdate transport system substrate-binding protein
VASLSILVVCVECGGLPGDAGPPTVPLTVFAASSLKAPFDKIGKKFDAAQKAATTFNYAGTQTLVSQLTQGAPGDVFASADIQHVTQLETAGLVHGQSTVFAHNRLEIAVAKGNPKAIYSLADLARPGLVVVLADPSVPAGKYAAQALKTAGVTVHPASLELQVTAVLSTVARGEADAGIVYVSDIVTSGKVDGVTIPDAQNVIADYPVALLKSAQNPEIGKLFIESLLSADGQAILKAAGFGGV